MSRRHALTQGGLWLGGAALATPSSTLGASPASAGAGLGTGRFRFSLNLATLRGQKLGIVKEIEVAAKAGYDGIEPWVDTLQEDTKGGGSLVDLKNRIRDSGLTVEGAIGFPEWIVDDDARREKGLERARREMELVAQIGGKRFAAPPAGATDLPKLELAKAADRYRVLLGIGEQLGLVPELELWGFSKNLNRLGDCVAVAMETGRRDACVLIDVFHLYKGGSDFRGLYLLGATTVQVMHLNDYPADPPREKIDDSYRDYPGEGTAPLVEMLTALRATGGDKVLSLELFNRKYWSQDPLAVAQTGLAKMKAVAEKASK
jgi:2-keto-myo-inositol isomerase